MYTFIIVFNNVISYPRNMEIIVILTGYYCAMTACLERVVYCGTFFFRYQLKSATFTTGKDKGVSVN